MCKVEQLGFGPATQRRAQQGSQRQIIFGRGKKRQQRGQILHRQFAAQLQSICPCNCQIGLFAGADDLGKQRRAALHQDQEITGMNRAVAMIGGNLHACVDHRLDLGSDFFRQTRGVVGFRDQINRVFPVFVLVFLHRRNQWPQIDPTGHLVFEGKV
ncbi:MAG: hypothetical protein ACD_54C01211G0001 [uncultured bacterium]|nr:MAG: hypothetical protein ACD_54C01211G0001 [uncultured bacterium]